jgi:signal transduction histidine kinase
MDRASNQALSRRLLVGFLVFGLFVLFDLALFGWLIFRSLSQREIERVLLETRTEAEGIAKQIARQAEKQGKDLYTAVAVERETQTYIDNILREREIVRKVEIHDRNGVLVFEGQSRARPPVSPISAAGTPPVGSPELRVDNPELSGTETKVKDLVTTFEVPDIEVPIGDNIGFLRIGLSPVELSARIETLRKELFRQAMVIGVVSMGLLLTALSAVWFLLQRSQRLELQAAEAERMAYIGTLASGLAHEIRNPLNSLNLNMQMLEEEMEEGGSAASAPTGKRLLAITRSELSRLERLVSDFLAYAKPRPLEMEDMPAVRPLERVREVLAGEIQKRGARVEVHDASGGARVRVDPGQINQLLLNLAQNALAATEETGRKPVLELAAARHGSIVALSVKDNGAGIPPEARERVFEIFYSTRKGGTGLGLAIVDRIARGHGGRVKVESEPGSGTTVTVELPAVAAAEPAHRTVESPA